MGAPLSQDGYHSEEDGGNEGKGCLEEICMLRPLNAWSEQKKKKVIIKISMNITDSITSEVR